MSQSIKIVGRYMATCPIQNQGWRKGPWTQEEDKLLVEYVSLHGEGRWSSVARCAGLNRSGKSCRLRWVNYLRPGLKRGQITSQEEGIIIELHSIWGNKWSTIARYLPGRTDNEIKNYWRTHFKKEKSRKVSFKRSKPQILKPKPPKEQPLEAQIIQVQTQDQLIPRSIKNEETNQIVPSQDQTLNNIEEQNLMMMITTPTMIDATCHDQDGSWWESLWNFSDLMQQDYNNSSSLSYPVYPVHRKLWIESDEGRKTTTHTQKEESGQKRSLPSQQNYNNNNQYCSKMALSLQNQANSTITNNYIINPNNNNYGYSWEGDFNNIYNYNEGCIF